MGGEAHGAGDCAGVLVGVEDDLVLVSAPSPTGRMLSEPLT